MRKAFLSAVLGVTLVVGSAVGLGAAPQARGANVETIWVYRSMFTPSMLRDASGVGVQLVNQDTIPHRIVLYRGYVRQSLDVTLQPGEWYMVPEPLTCGAGCYSASYTFVDADRSYVSSSGYCNSFCARMYVYNTGA